MLTISGKALGRKKPLFEDFSIPFPPQWDSGGEGNETTLRDLITHVVRGEVAAFKNRQEERKLLNALSAADIAWGPISTTAEGLTVTLSIDALATPEVTVRRVLKR
ncbi:MAG: hypothetical protein SNJ82_08920 [Gemmataceae bacterium]